MQNTHKSPPRGARPIHSFYALSITILALIPVFLMGCSPGQGIAGAIGRVGIVNGRVVSKRAVIARSIVGIVLDTDKGEALCSGTLISSQAVLTAAHCVDNNPQRIRIVFSTRLKDASPDLIRSATGFVQNPLWGKAPNGQGDLAVIKFSGSVPNGYRPVQLSNQMPKRNQSFLVAGYGVTKGDSHKGAGVLRKTTVRLQGMASSTQMETDGQSHSVCFGDSGGPAFVRVRRQWLQIGVASAVVNQDCNEASIHTVVGPYMQWIQSQM